MIIYNDNDNNNNGNDILIIIMYGLTPNRPKNHCMLWKSMDFAQLLSGSYRCGWKYCKKYTKSLSTCIPDLITLPWNFAEKSVTHFQWANYWGKNEKWQIHGTIKARRLVLNACLKQVTVILFIKFENSTLQSCWKSVTQSMNVQTMQREKRGRYRKR